MKILYFGTVCDIKAYDQLLKGCKTKPSVAPIVFETALLEGFYKNGADIDINSFPMVPTFPKSRLLCFGGNSETLPCGYKSHWLKTVNVPILKQWSRRKDAKRIIKRWMKENGSDGVVLTYSIPPFLVKDIIKYGKKYSVKTAAIVPDLLKNMYINSKQNFLIKFLKKMYLLPAIKSQGKYDGYIYLTEAMRDVVAPKKPYIVMEGVADINESASQDIEKSRPKAVMYAGRLHKKYGVMKLIDAFEKLEDIDAELWLFGDGSAVADIQSRAKSNGRIKYFGRVTRQEILEYEKKATLLVNPRSVREEFTQYSFPSKTIEYMYSGTPLLTTKLKGIPDEYFDYVFTAEDNDSALLADALRKALSLSERELTQMGLRAREFIETHKNATTQSRRIITFLKSI